MIKPHLIVKLQQHFTFKGIKTNIYILSGYCPSVTSRKCDKSHNWHLYFHLRWLLIVIKIWHDPCPLGGQFGQIGPRAPPGGQFGQIGLEVPPGGQFGKISP